MGRKPKALFHRWVCMRCVAIELCPPVGFGDYMPIANRIHRTCGGTAVDITLLGIAVETVQSAWLVGGSDAVTELLEQAQRDHART